MNENDLFNVNNLSVLLTAEVFLNIRLFDGIMEDIIKYYLGPTFENYI